MPGGLAPRPAPPQGPSWARSVRGARTPEAPGGVRAHGPRLPCLPRALWTQGRALPRQQVRGHCGQCPPPPRAAAWTTVTEAATGASAPGLARGLKRGPRPGVARATSSRARARPQPPNTGVPHEQRWGRVPVYAPGKANCDLAGTLRFPYQDFRTSRDRVAGGVRSASVHGGREPRRGASEPAGWSGTVQDYCLWPRRVPQTSGCWRDFPHGSRSHPPRRAGEDAAGLGSPRPVLTAWPPTTGPACHCLPSLLAASLTCLLGDHALSWRS